VKGGGTAVACRSFVRAEGSRETATGLPALRLAWAPERGLHATATRHANGTKLRSFSLPALLLLLPGGLIALALLAAVAAPAALATDIGTAAALKLLNVRASTGRTVQACSWFVNVHFVHDPSDAWIPVGTPTVTVSADRLRLSWTGPSVAEGLRVASRDTPDSPAITVRRVSTDSGLLGLLLQGGVACILFFERHKNDIFSIWIKTWF